MTLALAVTVPGAPIRGPSAVWCGLWPALRPGHPTRARDRNVQGPGRVLRGRARRDQQAHPGAGEQGQGELDAGRSGFKELVALDLAP